jgi:hypothetical protein
MAQTVTARRKIIPVDFFGHGHRISTQINVYGWPLAAQLNDKRSQWFDLEIAYISRIEHLGEIISDYPTSILRKDDIAFALVAGKSDGVIKKPPAGAFGRFHYPALIGVPSFELSGFLESTGKLDLHTLFAVGAERFFPLFRPSITLSTDPKVRLTGEMVLVNMEKVEFICAEEKGEIAPEA